MFNHTLSAYTPNSVTLSPAQSGVETLSASFWERIGARRTWLIFAAASFLVSVPVFVQAPLVRLLPELSLVLTVGWWWLSLVLSRQRRTQVWGDLLLGFSWSWLAGAIYWGWLRWEPIWHLPVEAIGLPLAFWCLLKGERQAETVKGQTSYFLTLDFLLSKGKVGSFFYLGSLFGTAVTDLYFYVVNLIPAWRQLMQVEPRLAASILRNALAQVQTPWGLGWATVLVAVLLVVGTLPLRSGQLHWWAFSGAVLSTILVDSLFWLAASVA